MYNKYIFGIIILLTFLVSGCYKSIQEVSKIELNRNWKFRQAGNSEYLPAEVPGSVHLDMLNAGLIEDPFYRSNEDSIQWVANEDWEYLNEFELDKQFLKNKNTFLIFEGLDTYAKVYLNDSLLLQTDNMFRQWKVEVSSFLKQNNQLKIHFYSPLKKNEEAAKKSAFPLPEQRAFTRKAPYQFGWDWGPRIVTSGIWKPVYLMSEQETQIHTTYFSTDSIVNGTAFISAEIEIHSEINKEIEIKILNDDQPLFLEKRELNIGESILKINFQIPQAKLWWSNGLGEAHLYHFNTIISVKDKIIDKKNNQIGIRTLKLIEKDDEVGKSFYFELNGFPVFMKGANYIPQDNFLTRVDSLKYKSIIESARLANMNMLRIWGGGVYESDLFYKLCDENGILIWQDFMFAGSMYPGDDHFIENCKLEAIDQIIRLRNHPSLALWCGNNEVDEAWHNWGWQQQFNWTEDQQSEIWEAYKLHFHQILPEQINNLDPNHQYWASSPKIGWGHKESMEEGDSHYWGVWWGKEPFSIYNEKVGRFMSEYGFQGFPANATFDSVLLPEDKYLYSSALKTHEKHNKGFEIINEYMKDEYKIPENFEDYAYVSQLLQAKGVGIALEAHRRAKPYCMGTLYWQLNDCWPVISWSGIDYYGNWKALHYQAQKVFKDLMISFEQQDDSVFVWIVSDRMENLDNELDLQLIDFDGNVLWSDQVKINIPSNSSQKYYRFSKKILPASFNPKRMLMYAHLNIPEGDIIDRFYYFSTTKELHLPKPEIKFQCSRISEGYEIIVETNKLAKNLYLEFKGITGRFTKNYFDLVPGKSKTLRFLTQEKIENPSELIKIKTLVDCY
ncbi:MAG: beta-mannosidase [Bacteroidetes bacterium HGW-Bacteroidetes-17]|jgi:beta-mannosidase|nr:MAG: beta-mannosidase [Bacteroidetes bacterium HGW-Bacteroidetes-17]